MTEPITTPAPWPVREENGPERPDQIRRMTKDWEEFCKELGLDRDALSGRVVEKIYSTSQAAAFLGRSPQWVYWGLRNNVFTYKDGTPIQPEQVGTMGRRRFTVPLIREMATSHHRRGNMTEDEVKGVIKRLLLAEFGPEAFSDTAKKK